MTAVQHSREGQRLLEEADKLLKAKPSDTTSLLIQAYAAAASAHFQAAEVLMLLRNPSPWERRT